VACQSPLKGGVSGFLFCFKQCEHAKHVLRIKEQNAIVSFRVGLVNHFLSCVIVARAHLVSEQAATPHT
jgi:hypothetical protein